MSTGADDVRGGPAPPHLRRAPTLRLLWRRMHVNNKNVMLAIIGDPGEGKSWAALRLGELLDPGFTAENVAFRPERLLERINEDHPQGDVTIADEAGVSMNAKTWWESDQIQIGNILETWRHQNRMLIFTLPVFTKLQKDARGLMNFLLTAYGIDRQESMSTWRFQWVKTNNKTGENIFPYPNLPSPDTGRITQYKTLGLALPSPELRDAYQERKEAFTSQLNEEALAQVRGDDTAEEIDPKELANEIIEAGQIAEFVSTNSSNQTEYVNKELLRTEYGLSHSESKAVKSLLERELE